MQNNEEISLHGIFQRVPPHIALGRLRELINQAKLTHDAPRLSVYLGCTAYKNDPFGLAEHRFSLLRGPVIVSIRLIEVRRIHKSGTDGRTD